ncbi:MAG: hypothetical protein H6908_03010 [Hyphomicrobiales bacterium]|nr:hypothetical protein [Hyphomicrobiales bacterium]
MRWLFIFSILCITLSTGAQAAGVCEEGVTRCKPYAGKGSPYLHCMITVCEDKPAIQPPDPLHPAGQAGKTEQEPIATCNKGLYKCERLMHQQDEYWACMKTECLAADAETAVPNCESGHKACLNPMYKYSDCVREVCKGLDGCPDAETVCTDLLYGYWHCVYDRCLGPLKYTYLESGPKLSPQEEMEHAVIRNEAFRLFDPRESRAYRSRSPGGNPTKLLMCPGGARYCSGTNFRTCVCEDGTPATDLTRPAPAQP